MSEEKENDVKEHPILFTGAMVRAILEGRKTQTRRPVKAPKGLKAGFYRKDGSPQWVDAPCYWEFVAVREDFDGLLRQGDPPFERFEIKRPFAVGDRLWVRETFASGVDGCPGGYAYRADHMDPRGDGPVHPMVWTPSIHMPRAASRLTLEVTDVRPERVKDITEADAKAEGAEKGMTAVEIVDRTAGLPRRASYRSGFELLWDSIYGSTAFAHGPLEWESNPWVWATTFRRIEAGK